MTQPTNLYNYLLANYEAIDSIPALTARLEFVEALLETVAELTDRLELPLRGGPVLATPFVSENDQNDDLEDEFDQGDHDELFADGGATEQSWDRGDHAELFESPNI